MSEPTIEDYKARLARVFDLMGGVRKVEMDANQPELPNIGDLIPVDEWVKMCESGGFIDYDGHGNFAMQRGDLVWLASHAKIYPSDITRLKLAKPDWATHVLWFNR